ncbi:MAG: DUF2974 domain-containing protein [Bacillota bacterium]|nr:DUF2974 domain-containing protein [Bacillota bacterium]
MGNLCDYAAAATASFSECPFGAVDSLLLSTLSYLHLEGLVPGPDQPGRSITIRELAHPDLRPRLFIHMLEVQETGRLLEAAAGSPRFADVRLALHVDDYRPAEKQQFAALCCLTGDGHCRLVFRGTDSTLPGWRESVSLLTHRQIPAQAAASAWLAEVARLRPEALTFSGHSKGGNLAIYAAIYAAPDVAARIRRIYVHDAPGFHDDVLARPGCARIALRVEKTMPRMAIVGLLLEQPGPPARIVRAEGFAGAQHSPFTWLIEDGDFITAAEVSPFSRAFVRGLMSWRERFNDDELERFYDALFTLIEAGGIQDFAELASAPRLPLAEVRRALETVTPDERRIFAQAIRALVASLLGLPADTDES